MRGILPAGPSFFDRLADAVQRRARHWWRRWVAGTRSPAAESALNWLRRCAGGGEGLHPACGVSAECPGLSAATIGTLRQFGDHSLANRFATRLVELQKRDGSIPDAGLLHASLFNTAQAARAFAETTEADTSPAIEQALRRACHYLVGRIDDDGAIRIPRQGGSFDRWAPESVHLSGMATVAVAAERWNIPAWREAASRALRHALRTIDAGRPSAPTHILAHAVEALWELRALDERSGTAARRFLETIAARQRTDGSVSADVACAWTSSAGLAHLASLWFQAGMIDPGRRAMACLAARQRDDGGWAGSWGRGAAYFPRCCSAWTAKYFLDASVQQVRAEFAAGEPSLVEPLADDDGRLRAVEQLAAQTAHEFGHDAELLDAGCGSGRYLRALVGNGCGLRLTGVDPSPSLLRHGPAAARLFAGNLLDLPFESGRFGAACCIEALEHSLTPERAVDELCRVVHPGGRVMVVDKDVRFQTLSRVAPWERWFTPQSVATWLAKHCEAVEFRPLPPGPHQRTPGLFLCWTGVKRVSTATLPARLAA